MRIRGLRIDGFGKFADFSCGPLEQPVTIFQGGNEAGKSTLLAFIRRVLFGFPDGRSRRNPYPPLAGGRHGGSITIVSDANEIVTVHRLQAAGGGRVKLITASGETLPPTDLPQLLGHHSKDVFQNVFAFTLDELHDDALLKDERVNSQIYSAGMGATKLPPALKRLDQSKSKLFLKGGSKHAIHEAASVLDSVDSSLRNVANNAEQYGKLSARLNEVEEKLEQLNGRRREYDSLFTHQRRLKTAWDDWNDLNTIERKLAALPAIEEFPENGVSRLETLEERVRNTRREYESASGDVTDARTRTEARIEHKAILSRSTDIRSLEQGRTSFDESVRDLPRREIELEERRKSLAATLKDLGPDWDESRLENFDLSINVRENISQYQEQLREAREELARSKSKRERDETALRESAEAENNAEKELKAATKPSLDGVQVKQRRRLIRAAESRLNQFNSARESAATLQNQLNSLTESATPAGRTNKSNAFAVSGILAGITLLVAGAVIGGDALLLGIFAGLALAGFSAYLFAAGRQAPGTDAESHLAAPIRASLRESKVMSEKLQSELERDAASLGVEIIDETSLNEVNEMLDDQQDRAGKFEQLSRNLIQEKERTRQRKNATERSEEAVEQASTKLEAVRREWLEWLRARGLRDTFVPETVIELRAKVELGLNQLRELQNWQRRIKRIRKDVDEYAALVEPLASEFNVTFDRTNPRVVAGATERLVRMYREVERKVSDRTKAKADLKKAERQMDERERDLRNAEAETKELLQSGGGANAEDFRKRASLHLRRADFKDKRRHARNRLQRISGPGESLESLIRTLGETDIEAIGAEILRTEETRNEIDDEIKELSTERGSIQSDLKNLTSEEESSKLRAERHRLLEQIRSHAREWVVHTIARNLLKEAQSKFEKERQPDVLRHSEGYFRGMTGGRYQAVFSPLGSSEIHVKDHDDSTKQPAQLSRGAREQLFLSLRFGLVRDLGQRSERLPVIIDEALVNFDPDRGRRAAHAFVELAEQNQVLVFTCHPQIVQWFEKAAAERDAQPPHIISIN